MSSILIVGGYGAFGARAAELLARHPEHAIIVAGRSRETATAFARRLARKAATQIRATTLDATTATANEIRRLGARVLINASGPFQRQDYELARAAIAAGCHYIDLADAHAFVAGIEALDADARAADVCVVSGASSVPGLSSAVVQEYAKDFASLQEVEIAISPGNSFDPGVATVASILTQAGKPHEELREGAFKTVYGWQGLQRARFPGLGRRWLASVDVPDLTLLPRRFQSLRDVRFKAGLEVGLFHLGVWGMSWLVRSGLIRDLSAWSSALLAVKRRLGFLGSDRGGMFVELRGSNANGERMSLRWHLVAGSGHGPYVPAVASVILARRLIAGEGPPAGAHPCVALFSLEEFEATVAGLDIACGID